jgi:hypothetical protein
MWSPTHRTALSWTWRPQYERRHPEALATAHAAAKAKGGKVVHLPEIARYLGADPAKVAIAIEHLATARAAVETSPGQWVLVSQMPAPAIKRGKILTMPVPVAPSSTVSRAATAVDRQTDAHRHQDAGDDG